MNKIVLLLLFFVNVVNASNYSYTCLNPAAYDGSKLIGGGQTCNARYDYYSGSGQVFNGYVWAANSTCTGGVNPLLVGAEITNMGTDSTISRKAKYIDLTNRDGCCTDKKSLCMADFSNICANPATYNSSATKRVSGTYYNCDWLIDFGMYGHDLGTAVTCSDVASTSNPDEAASICCSDGKSLCWKDYSKICKNPGTYDGSKSVTIGGHTNTCDDTIKHGMYKNLNFATLKCDDFNNKIDLENHLAPSCCSDTKSLCYHNFSKLCKDPSTYNKDGKWDKSASGNTNNCGHYLNNNVLNSIKKANLNISNVDSNTCADYEIESGDGTMTNLLQSMESQSECCGANGVGVAKNGCKAAALDTTAFGPKSRSFGVISFILPMIVMAYFHCAI